MRLELIINIITGILTGIISGCIVSRYYSEKDRQERFEKLLGDNKREMIRYIDVVRFDLEQIMRCSSDEAKNKAIELQKFLLNPPRFESFSDLSRIPKCYHDTTKNVYSLLRDITNYLKTGNLDKLTILKYSSDLMKAQIEILKISTKEQEPSNDQNCE